MIRPTCIIIDDCPRGITTLEYYELIALANAWNRHPRLPYLLDQLNVTDPRCRTQGKDLHPNRALRFSTANARGPTAADCPPRHPA